MNSSIVSEKDPVKRSNNPLCTGLFPMGLFLLGAICIWKEKLLLWVLDLEKNPCPPRLFISLKSESNSKTLECQLEMQN